MFIIVVFPAPLWPNKTVISLLLIVIFKLSAICVSRLLVWNFLQRSLMMIACVPRGDVVYSFRCRFLYVSGCKFHNNKIQFSYREYCTYI